MKQDRSTIRDVVDEMAASRSNAVFLAGPEAGGRISFADLRQQANEVAQAAFTLGLTKGDKVAFMLDNGLFTSSLLLGAMYGGLVAVPLNARAGRSHIAYTLDHCDAKVVFVSAAYAALIEEIQAEIDRPIVVIACDEDRGPDWQESKGETTPLPEIDANDDALLMYTSGSTGQPKGAVLSHRNLVAAAWNSVAAHDLSAADRSLCVLPLYHINAVTVTLISTLVTGGAVVMPHKFVVRDFWSWIARYECTWSALVPAIISQLLDWIDPREAGLGDALRRIRFMRSSSAPLAPALHRAFDAKFPVLLVEAMGSTEAAGNVFSNPLPPGKNKIGTPGRPYGFEAKVGGPSGAEAPQGEPGEIVLRGPGIMKGYYKNPEATAAVLGPDGWFRTGDLAYADEDGYFFVVGRAKELIIKGGMNIAPRQIDDALESHAGILEAAVLGVPDHYFGEDIVAFVVARPGAQVDERELLALCESQLGSFKTPSRVHFVDELPKGPSGKVQRLRLAECFGDLCRPGHDAAVAVCEPPASGDSPDRRRFVAPRNPIEELIAEIWNAVLDAGTMGIHDSFFAHGGGSLQAIESLSLLRKRFDIEMSVNEFFRHPTVAQQALIVGERLGAHPGDSGAAGACAKPLKCDSAQLSRAALEKVLSERRKGAPHRKAIPLRETSSPCPLSDGQTGIWFQEQIAPGMRAYHEGDAARLEGPLDIDVLEEAINVLVERHESLRTLIQVVDGAPVQVVLDSWRLPITLVDLTDLPPLEQQTEVQRELVEEPRRAYRLDQAPGVRAMLLRLGPDVHIFMLSLHHLICDGWSLGVLFRELGDLYRAGVQRKPHALCRMDLQYGDYAAWQHGRVESGSLAGDLDFWKHYLAGVPAAIDLPIKATRPKEFSYNGKRHIHSIGRATLERLRQLGQREETSLFMVLTAAFKALLYRYTNQKDIVIGVPIANREQPELLSLVGFLIDFQALRTDLSGNPTFRTLLQRVNQGLFEVDAHRAIPFHKVVEALQPKRDLSRTPLYQVMLVWKDRHVQMQFMDLEGLKVSYVPFHAHAAKTDLTMWLTDVGDDLWVEVEYCAELFSAEMIQRLTGHFQTLLAGVVADPDCRISELPLLSETERRKLLVDWNRTEMEYPRDIPLAALVEEQAARAPDSTAVVFGEQSLTYRELNKRANQLARELVRHGAGPDALVGIFVERSLDMMVALLAVAKSGAGYLPLDTCVPAARLLHMIEDSGLRVLVTHSNLQSELPRFLGGIVTVDDVKWHANRWENLDVAVKPEQVAYAIYTSGSTGRPKCVEVSYRSLLNLLWSVRDWLNFKASDRLLAVSSISFDIAGADIWLPWVVGATTILAGREAAAEGMQLRNLIERHDITFMQATPVTWRLLLGAGWRGKPNMRIVCTGEAMPRDLAAELVPMVRTMWNLYGPTETTIWSTGYLVEDGEAPVLIGRPVGNTKCYILDEQRQPVPIGSIGELCIAGDGLARGYRNRPELTEEKFVPNPLSREPGARMYRTGDLARYRPDGNIECLGRLDHQVKIRGFRIELGEIEAALAQCPGVAQSAVLAREDCPGDKRLVAYLVPQADTELSVSALRTALQGRLPDYMVPMAFVALASLPLTPNGKLDRKALPAPDPRRLELDQAYEAPRTPIEKQLAAIWAHVLGLETIGIHDNFFELGGHSLLATRVIARVREEFNVNVPLRALFDAPRLAEFGLQVLQALIDAAPDDAPDRRQGIALTAAHC